MTPPAAGAANMSCQTENRPPEQYRDLMGAVICMPLATLAGSVDSRPFALVHPSAPSSHNPG